MSKVRTLYIVGTGGFAKEVAQLATEINATKNQWDSISYVSVAEAEVGKPMPFGEVVGTDRIFKTLTHPADVAIGIGNPGARTKLGAWLLANKLVRMPNLVHPVNGMDLNYVTLGHGNIVARGAAFTCDIKVGDLNVFNLNSTVGHDARIGSFNVINPGCNISGAVSIGDGCLLGTGCQILEGISIADGCKIGAGAVVVKSIDIENSVFVGIPAKALTK